MPYPACLCLSLLISALACTQMIEGNSAPLFSEVETGCPHLDSQEAEWSQALFALERQEFQEAALLFKELFKKGKKLPGSQEAYFYFGLCQWQLGEYAQANNAFNCYLKGENRLGEVRLREVMQYKFAMAESLSQGGNVRLFGLHYLPKWGNGQELALQIYDEIIATLVNGELVARALCQKAFLHRQMGLYREAVELYRLCIKRFPYHELTPEAYHGVSLCYLSLLPHEIQNPDLLTFAAMNLKKFKENFPRDPRLCEVEAEFRQMEDVYAYALYDRGCFYERTHHPEASLLYYHQVVKQYPHSYVAEQAKKSLERLDPCQDSGAVIECQNEAVDEEA